MKGINALIRLHKQHLDVKRAYRANMESQRDEQEQRAHEMALVFADERKAAAESLESRQTFTAYARRMTGQLRALASGIYEINLELARQDEEIAEAFQTLKGYELTRDEHDRKIAQDEAHRERAELDEIGATLHRRHSAY